MTVDYTFAPIVDDESPGFVSRLGRGAGDGLGTRAIAEVPSPRPRREPCDFAAL